MGSFKRIAVYIAKRIVKAFGFFFTFLFCRKEFFSVWEDLGFHVTPAHFYQPIPTLKDLDQEIFHRKLANQGVDFNEQGQQRLLHTFEENYKHEYDQMPLEPTDVPHQYYINNRNFESVDGEVLYCMVRDIKPRRVIEVGSGYSTLVTLSALEKNRSEGKTDSTFTAIEPYPREFLLQAISDSVVLVNKKVQEVDAHWFSELQENDILFIDSSHVLKIGSDVYHEYLEIIPSLNKGVIVHIHDIFLPYDYPKKWVLQNHLFWNEQYLLQAFLSYNDHFEVLWGGSFMHTYHPEALAKAFRSYHPETRHPGSFWIRKVK